MRIPKNISLDQQTAKIAGDMPEFSAWVRAMLLTWDELGRPPVDVVARTTARRTWRRQVDEFHAALWRRARLLHLVEFDQDGDRTIRTTDMDGSINLTGHVLLKMHYLLECDL